ncbi:MAG: site-2 protease family protein [Candidatus Pacebacteria bacterium]|jgi:Zn-dependent protease|nr:site-2 protease family protein [Candidatus Paceibacterota bacterium]MDD4994597.1 site-2 protease family protein [Candidatus Paceibacterota bacterium]MDD5535224.1 site-2 protease family protein [Candidatus Paceibacterota bacterium]
MFTEIPLVFQLIILLFSVIIHEVFHGLAALYFGDDTAEKMGRLTLNPIKHLDPIGSVLLPLILVIMNSGFVFGWAKPVPYNPLKLKNPRRDTALLALSGPLANFSLALFFGLITRVIMITSSFISLLPYLMFIVWINLILGIFNLMPIPPLDGSKILFYLFPSRELEMILSQYGIILLLFFIMFAGSIILPLVMIFFSLFTGIPLA